MLQRRHLLSAAAACLAAPAFASRPDALDTTPFGSSPLLQPLQGWSDGLDRVAEGLRVEGRLPAALRGTLFRNGPGLLARDGQRYRHWFDGDGLVQAWRFEQGQLRHQARFVQTKKFRAEQAAGRFLAPAFGTAVPGAWPVRAADDVNTANTSVTVQDGKLYALWEGGSAIELDPDSLATRGPKAWAPELKGVPFSAHPKRETDGTLWNFGTFAGALVIYQIGANGQLKRQQLLKLPVAAMVHDFVVSQRFIAFLLPPLSMNPAALQAGSSMVGAMRWDAAAPMRLLVIDKSSLQPLRTVELAPELVFHFGNAWDDGRWLRFDYVKSDAAEFLSGRLNTVLQGREASGGELSTAQFMAVDTQTGQLRRSARPEAVEFPQVDPRVVAQRYRYVYAPTQRGLQDRWGFNALQRLDIDSGRLDSFAFDAHTVVEEHLLVPKPGSTREGQGWLVGTGFDSRRQRSFASVFDAQRLADGPLARVWLPYWVPFGFHSHFHAA
jgi:all-trans-8'-apo-beta-carotenal 15,15'-oxygenase